MQKSDGGVGSREAVVGDLANYEGPTGVAGDLARGDRKRRKARAAKRGQMDVVSRRREHFTWLSKAPPKVRE